MPQGDIIAKSLEACRKKNTEQQQQQKTRLLCG